MKSQKLRSHLPKQPRPLPELEFGALIKVMRALEIYHEPVVGKQYCFRFTGSPYNCFVEDCRSIQVMAHNKGRAVSPLNLVSILIKFDISEEAFFEAYDRISEAVPSLQLDDEGPEVADVRLN